MKRTRMCFKENGTIDHSKALQPTASGLDPGSYSTKYESELSKKGAGAFILYF